MQHSWIIALTTYLIFGKFAECKDEDLSIPETLSIGGGSASYQIEGAWNESGKGESVWDRWLHTDPTHVVDGTNGDIACNAYYKYKEDVQLIKSIGLNFYRFSVSWPRVMPNGHDNMTNKNGLQYYKNLTKELVANGIEPIVTMYHWDHPQTLEEMGGWTNDLMVDKFASYARILFEALGDHVKIWLTINEPNVLCLEGYGGNILAPGRSLKDSGVYDCMHNVLKAHAKTYHIYDEEFRSTQHGEIGIGPECTHYIAENDNDTESVETAFQFDCGWTYHPIYKGDYPEIMKTRIAKISAAQGYSRSRLPKFTDEWIAYIKGTADYVAVNHYTTRLVAPDPEEASGKYNSDNGLVMSVDPNWPRTAAYRVYIYPEGLGALLRKVKDEYNNPTIRIMENGFPDTGEVEDYDRISYHHSYLKAILGAVKSGCNVKAYAIWSVMDNFEWAAGYSVRFGMLKVNFDDPNRTRSEKLSTSWWKKVLKTRKLQPVPTNSNSTTIVPKTLSCGGPCKEQDKSVFFVGFRLHKST